MRRALICILALASLTVGSPVSAAGAPPPDYRDRSGLSEPAYEVVRERLRIPMRDGVRLYAEVVRPAVSGRFPVIVEWSPYNGGVGGRSGSLPGSSGGLAGYFAPRGYAVVLADVRGTGNSEGCLDYMGPVDRLDAYDLVEWLAARAWSSGRVGMTGVSYVGSTPIFAAAARPPHLTTIVPVAGIAQMYDHQFQAGVPYYLQWLGPAAYYDATAQTPADQDDPGWARNVGSYGCGAPNSALSNHVDLATGRYTPWHAARDFRDAAANADIPIFLVQGVNDGAVRELAIEWFTRRAPGRGDKLWLGQWGHQASDRGAQWRGVLHRWFDKHLQQRAVDTGPPVEVFLNDTEALVGEDYVTVDGPIRTAESWPDATGSITLHASGLSLDGGTLAAVAEVGSATFAAAARGRKFRLESDPIERDVELTGFPRFVLDLAVTAAQRTDVIAVLYDYDPEIGFRREITQAAINPELRNGLGTVTPVVPGERMVLKPPAQPVAHLLRAGHVLQLEIGSTSADKAPAFPGPAAFTLYSGGADPTRVTIDIADAPLHADPDP